MQCVKRSLTLEKNPLNSTSGLENTDLPGLDSGQTSAEFSESIEKIEHALGYVFQDRSLLMTALTHSSYSNERFNENPAEKLPDNERLEFLGDAVLGLLIAEELMATLPDACEGKLSRLRSSLVSQRALFELAKRINLGTALRFGVGEKRTGGATKPSIVAGAAESVVGALYLDGGMEPVRRFLKTAFQDMLESLVNTDGRGADHKTLLQELTQAKLRLMPLYETVSSWGPDHEKTFRVRLQIDGLVEVFGEGRSKKEAEQEAARQGLECLKEKGMNEAVGEEVKAGTT